MKKFLKSGLAVMLSLTMIFSSLLVGLREMDFSGLFALKVNAASESDLSFTLDEDGLSYTLDRCNALASGELSIPSTYNGMPVTAIGYQSFRGCTALTSVTIPSSVTSIGDYAFYGCSGLSSVTIPSSVTSIGHCAFYSCGVLTSVEIPSGVTSIGSYAFYNCKGLTSVTIPNSVTSIGSYAFYNCKGLTSVTIPNSVTSIEDSTFGNCSGLTSVTIPNSVTSIGAYAFYYCSGLTSVTIPDSVTTIESYAFYYCSGLTSVTIPNSVTSIGRNSFYCCVELTSVTIPNSVTSIGDYAFYNCIKLTSIVTPDSVKSIGNYCFAYCRAAETLTIGENVESIGDAAFSYCDKLTSVTIPASVTSIGNEAFLYCEKLTSVTIPASVTSMGVSVFKNCSKLTDISVDAANTNYCDVDGVLFNKNKTTIIQYPKGKSGTSYAIPSGVEKIEEKCFSGCNLLESVSVPESVTDIGEQAFYYCGKLATVSGGENIKNIGDLAFYECILLSTFTMPGNLVTIGKQAFFDCPIASVTLPKTLTSIGDRAFGCCSALKSITIPASVVTIGSEPFLLCESLAVLKVDADNEFYSSKSNVLFNKDQTELILCPVGKQYDTYEIPSTVKTVNDRAFYGCSSLTRIYASEGLEVIGDYAFSNCTNLVSFTMPDTVTEIGSNVFNFCSNLITVKLSENITIIGASCFKNCNKLVSVVIPEGVTRICTEAFNYCENLTAVVIPASATLIEYGAFSNCTSLWHVLYTGTEAQWENLEKSNNTYLTDAYRHYGAQGSDIEVADYRTATCIRDGVYSCYCRICEEFKDNVITAAGSHSFNGSGECTSCGTLKTECVSSSHNYENDCSETWTITREGAMMVAITFSEETFVEKNYDFIKIYDSYDNLVGTFTGDELQGKRIVVNGNVIKIVLLSDSSVTKYGFDVVEVEELNNSYIAGINKADGSAKTDVDTLNSKIKTNVQCCENITEFINFMSNTSVLTHSSHAAGNKEFFGTGSTITLLDYSMTEYLDKYTVIVSGDVNGDSVCDVIDCAQVEAVANGRNTLTDVYFTAADSNSDDAINSTDYQAIINTMLA
ncbi:MAG: leucine-rich repeat protein [Acutalibacteraceae bacterium]